MHHRPDQGRINLCSSKPLTALQKRRPATTRHVLPTKQPQLNATQVQQAATSVSTHTRAYTSKQESKQEREKRRAKAAKSRITNAADSPSSARAQGLTTTTTTTITITAITRACNVARDTPRPARPPSLVRVRRLPTTARHRPTWSAARARVSKATLRR